MVLSHRKQPQGSRPRRRQSHLVNTAAGGALIEQAIVFGADELFALGSEANELTENLYRSLLTSIDRASNVGRV
jgi:hypothetical protein